MWTFCELPHVVKARSVNSLKGLAVAFRHLMLIYEKIAVTKKKIPTIRSPGYLLAKSATERAPKKKADGLKDQALYLIDDVDLLTFARTPEYRLGGYLTLVSSLSSQPAQYLPPNGIGAPNEQPSPPPAALDDIDSYTELLERHMEKAKEEKSVRLNSDMRVQITMADRASNNVGLQRLLGRLRDEYDLHGCNARRDKTDEIATAENDDIIRTCNSDLEALPLEHWNLLKRTIGARFIGEGRVNVLKWVTKYEEYSMPGDFDIVHGAAAMGNSTRIDQQRVDSIMETLLDRRGLAIGTL
ncbi:hypothetical protein HDV00_005599 [Rhizophlyctis rosea]|nr:hypothetical protein HDV00_005599 [Rhizophlyctis rosea]